MTRATENARPDNARPSKLWELTARLDNAAPDQTVVLEHG